jgi:hypothetical protein
LSSSSLLYLILFLYLSLSLSAAIIKFEDVPIITPNGDLLVESMSFQVYIDFATIILCDVTLTEIYRQPKGQSRYELFDHWTEWLWQEFVVSFVGRFVADL